MTCVWICIHNIPIQCVITTLTMTCVWICIHNIPIQCVIKTLTMTCMWLSIHDKTYKMCNYNSPLTVIETVTFTVFVPSDAWNYNWTILVEKLLLERVHVTKNTCVTCQYISEWQNDRTKDRPQGCDLYMPSCKRRHLKIECFYEGSGNFEISIGP